MGVDQLVSGGDVNDPTYDSVTTESAMPKVVGGAYHYAAAYDGSDPDARLDAAISAAGSDETIYLEHGSYTADRTFLSSARIVGTGAGWGPGTALVSVTWTFNASVIVENLGAGGGSDSAFTVAADDCGFFQLIGNTLNITFQSGTTGGIVDGTMRDVSVTDNGNNTIGDLG